MNTRYLQIAGAFIAGVIVPCLVLQIGARVVPSGDSKQTEPSTSVSVPQLQLPTHIRVQDRLGQAGEMELEAYLVGVILAEMPTKYDMDALCAQAVVARTYALKRQQEQRHPGGAICTDPGCCQAYVSLTDYLDGLGYQEDIDRASQAVSTTSGEVLTYGGKLIEATYFSCSGGRTEDAVAVWGVDYPYLQAVESPGEENMENYRKEVYFTTQELEQALGRTLSGSPTTWLGWSTYTEGGGVDTIYIAGMPYTGLELRSLLKLNSTAFTVTPLEDGVLIKTAGKGHRVGMSQSGAQAMASRGSTYQAILAHYYPGAVIDKNGNMG